MVGIVGWWDGWDGLTVKWLNSFMVVWLIG